MDAATQALLAQLQAEVLVLQTAAATAAAATAATAPAPVPVPVFALAPALANTATFIDVTSTSGTKHFKGATEPLNKQPFDFADSSDLQVFLDLVLKKSQVWGWNTIFTIPVTNAVTGLTTNHSLISEYGVIPLASVRTQAMSYYANPTKQAQDSFMACQCLLGSLTLDFLKLITADSTDYHLPPIVADDGPVPSGPLLLKLIISQAHVDSRATVTHIRTSLTMLDAKMIELDSNVETFNVYVKAQIKNLSARGETPNDLLTNLFKGYKVADDVEFADFIRRKENAYEEGEDINPNNLMADSLTKYKARKLVDKWSAPTKEQGQILALSAQVEQLKSAAKQQPKKPTPKNAPKSGKKDNKWAWKDVLPKDGEPTTKEFGGKHYHVDCKFHPNQWVCHSTAECSKNPSNDGSTPPGSPTERRLAAAKIAAAALPEDDGETEDETEGDY
jgi:hypothetical protein